MQGQDPQCQSGQYFWEYPEPKLYLKLNVAPFKIAPVFQRLHFAADHRDRMCAASILDDLELPLFYPLLACADDLSEKDDRYQHWPTKVITG
jgi:hypothetical protein